MLQHINDFLILCLQPIITYWTSSNCNSVDRVFRVKQTPAHEQNMPQLVFSAISICWHYGLYCSQCTVPDFSILSKLSLLEDSFMLSVSCLVLRSEADAHKGHSGAWPGTPSEALWKLIPWLKAQPYLLFPYKCFQRCKRN